MPSSRSKRLWTLELSLQAMEEHVCYDRHTGELLLLEKTWGSCRYRW
jgi:hypothetical protein